MLEAATIEDEDEDEDEDVGVMTVPCRGEAARATRIEPVAFGDRDATRVRAAAVWKERAVRADETRDNADVAKSIYVRENARSTRTHTRTRTRTRGWEVATR